MGRGEGLARAGGDGWGGSERLLEARMAGGKAEAFMEAVGARARDVGSQPGHEAAAPVRFIEDMGHQGAAEIVIG